MALRMLPFGGSGKDRDVLLGMSGTWYKVRSWFELLGAAPKVPLVVY